MQESSGNSRSSQAKIIFISIIVIVLVGAYIFFSYTSKQQQALYNLFELLVQQGYQPNIGLSGAYSPGTVIQTTETASDGLTRVISPPIIFLWGKDCFPELKPVSSNYTLPETSSQSSSSLQLSSQALIMFAPALGLDSQIVASQKLTMENVHLQTFARGDLSQQFSDKCVNALSRSLEEGDQPEWFAVINETVVADRLDYEIQWQEDTSANTRREAAEKLKTILENINQEKDVSEDDAEEIELSVVSETKTVISAPGPVILGYRMRPLQPVYTDE